VAFPACSDVSSRCWAVGNAACLLGVAMSAAPSRLKSMGCHQILLFNAGNSGARGRQKKIQWCVSEGGRIPSGKYTTPKDLGRTKISRKKVMTASKNTKTYNRRDSQMVTHSSTSRPVQCLCMAERTGCPVLTDLWSYVSFGEKTVTRIF
jgi:hypothetical protein